MHFKYRSVDASSKRLSTFLTGTSAIAIGMTVDDA